MRKAIDILKAIYFWTAMISVTGVIFIFLQIHRFIYIILNKSDFDVASHNWTCIWGKTIINLMPWWRVYIEGFENIPSETSNNKLVIVANHESMTDIWILCYLHFQFRWLSKAEVFKVPIIGHAMRLAGYIPVTRGDKDSHQQAMKSSAEWVQKGIPMLFFPEGTRSETSELRPFKMGAFKLARDTGASILPVALKGAGKLMSKGSPIPKSARVQVCIMPIVPPPAPDGNLQEYADDIRTIIQSKRDSMQ